MTNSPNKPEPDPKPNNSRPIWELVMEDMAERHQEGIRKYGVPLQAHNGRKPLVDAYQEALDMAVYLRQAIEEQKGNALVVDWGTYTPMGAPLETVGFEEGDGGMWWGFWFRDGTRRIVDLGVAAGVGRLNEFHVRRADGAMDFYHLGDLVGRIYL